MSYTLKKQGNLVFKIQENKPEELLAKIENRKALVTKTVGINKRVLIENKLVFAQSFDEIQLSLYLSDGTHKYYSFKLEEIKKMLKETKNFDPASDYIVSLDNLTKFENKFIDSNLTSNIDMSSLSDIDKMRISKLGVEWWSVLKHDLDLPDIRKAARYVSEQRKEKTIYPDADDTLKALLMCPFNQVKVVILGQDPYHNGAADGLAFSTKLDVVPPSLFQIFTAISDTYQECKKRNLSGDLKCWAKQGVLLLNTCLTVEYGAAGSHKGIGWEVLTACVLKKLSLSDKPIVYLLLGKEANEFRRFLTSPYQLVLNTEHPAASIYQKREWEHKDVFVKANNYLLANNLSPIVWDTDVIADYDVEIPF